MPVKYAIYRRIERPAMRLQTTACLDFPESFRTGGFFQKLDFTRFLLGQVTFQDVILMRQDIEFL